MVFVIGGQQARALRVGFIRRDARGLHKGHTRGHRIALLHDQRQCRWQNHDQHQPGPGQQGGRGGRPAAERDTDERNGKPDAHVGGHRRRPPQQALDGTSIRHRHPGHGQCPDGQAHDQHEERGGPHGHFRRHNRPERHRLCQHEGERPLLFLARHHAVGQRQDQQRHEIDDDEGEVEAPGQQAQRAFEFRRRQQTLARLGGHAQIRGQQVALSHRQRAQGIGRQDHHLRGQPAAEVRGIPGVGKPAHAFAPGHPLELGGEPPQPLALLAARGLDGPVLEFDPAGAVPDAVGDRTADNRHHRPQDGVGLQHLPLVPDDAPEHGRHPRWLVSRRAASSASPAASSPQPASTARAVDCRPSTQPMDGAS